MKRALMYSSVASMIYQFNMDNIRLLISQGYAVDVACNMEQSSTISAEKLTAMKRELQEMGVRVFHVPVPRKVTALKQIWNSMKLTRKLLNENGYDLIHCHSPIGSVVCRLAHRFSKGYECAKMIYTAHGFHFYRGAPLANWLMFYPIEQICARFTDVLITINKEDYALAQKKMPVGEVAYVPGIGVDTHKFRDVNIDREQKRSSVGLTENDLVLLSVGELIDRKNHAAVVRALARLTDKRVKYLICGRGPNEEKLETLARELGVGDQLMLLGYRTDIAELLQIADIYVFPSLQEGLPVALMEAMSAGRAVVCSEIRGNTDLIENHVGGYLVPATDDQQYAEKLTVLLYDEQLRERMGEHNVQAAEAIDKKNVYPLMERIYSEMH